MKRILTAKNLATVASVAVGVLPAFVLIEWFNVSRKLIVGYGVLAYVLGVTVFKLPLYHLIVVRYLHGKLSNLQIALGQGFISAISELGAALLFFLYVVPDLTFVQLIGFSVAAGAVEAIFLPLINPFKGTPLEDHAEKVFAEAKPSVEFLGILERVLALVTHVSSRGLIYAGVIRADFFPILIALATFAAIDGRAYYGHLQKWRFDDPRVLGKFYLYFGGVGVLQTACFLLFYFQV